MQQRSTETGLEPGTAVLRTEAPAHGAPAPTTMPFRKILPGEARDVERVVGLSGH